MNIYNDENRMEFGPEFEEEEFETEESEKDTVLFLGVWEHINNQDFNSLEFEGIKNEAVWLWITSNTKNSLLVSV